MDEPLSNLDAKLRAATRVELVELQRRLDATIVYVTHDQVEAMTMGRRVAILDRGRLQQVGSPRDVYDRPASLFVAGFVGTPPMNIVHGAAAAALARPGLHDVIVGVRPEHCTLVDGGTAGAFPATVDLVEHLGHEQHVICRFPDGQPLTVRQASRLPAPAPQSAVWISPDPASLHFFDATTGGRVES